MRPYDALPVDALTPGYAIRLGEMAGDGNGVH